MYIPLTPDGKIEITCPYCFEKFAHDKVCFRLESVFDEDKLDPIGEGRTATDIAKDARFPDTTRKDHLRQYQERAKHKKGASETYDTWWKQYGQTTEVASRASDKKLNYRPYERPVLPMERMTNVFQHPVDGPFAGGAAGPRDFVLKATDPFGKVTDRRVCPHCHNPLHGNYGMYPVHFISIIGARGAGKTVYISQLLNRLNVYTSKAEVTAYCNGCGASTWDYILSNTCAMNEPLPLGTEPTTLVQPMLYMLSHYKDNSPNTNMIVIYDISGENCEGQDGDQEGMKNFGKFIFYSDALMVFVAPEQIVQRWTERVETNVGTDTVVRNIAAAFATDREKRDARGQIKIPVAICVSKGDESGIRDNVLRGASIEAVRDAQTPGKFDAADYNPTQAQLKEYFVGKQNTLATALKNLYANYNFFIFTALGCGTKDEVDGKKVSPPVLSNHPSPKRIEEPFMWILHKLGYIETNADINEPPHPDPEPWECPKGHGKVEGRSNHCPKCHRGRDGRRVCKKNRIG